MKKTIIITLFAVIALYLTGCVKEKDNFEHYDLKDKDLNLYTYYGENQNKDIYALADITSDSSESFYTGLFYKIKENDYILLETFESNMEGAYNEKTIYQFYNGNLYGIGQGDTPMIFQVKLKGEESKAESIKFMMNDEENPFLIREIKSIENNDILMSGYTYINGNSEYAKINCSLINLTCQIKES